MKRVIALTAFGSTFLAAAGQPTSSTPTTTTASPARGAADVDGATTTAPAAEGFGAFPFVMLVLMLVFMYFVLIRPQNKEQKRRRGMMDGIKVGDNVVTIGGIHGVVARSGEQDIDVRVADGVVMTFNLGAVNQVVKDGEPVDGRK